MKKKKPRRDRKQGAGPGRISKNGSSDEAGYASGDEMKGREAEMGSGNGDGGGESIYRRDEAELNVRKGGSYNTTQYKGWNWELGG